MTEYTVKSLILCKENVEMSSSGLFVCFFNVKNDEPLPNKVHGCDTYNWL